MYLGRLMDYVRAWDEVRVLNRAVQVEDCTVAAVALARTGKRACLYLLQYDPTLAERREEAELAKASEYSSDESNGGGSSGFLPLFFGSSNGAVSSGAQRANITARGGSFSGMSSGS